jgi:SAM-dependent methyltransferase
MRYALLTAPSSNRVYAGEAPRLTEAELAVFGEVVLGARLRDPATERIGGVPYVGFEVDPPLTERDVAYLSNVSSAYALFAREGELLRPVPLTPLAHYDDDLLTILKYPGKTNEQFTQLLLNLTVLASRWASQMLERRLVVLDPLCGRGTTLNQALRYGYDAIGVEADSGHVDAYSAFLRTWLRRKRIKHTVDLHPVRHHGKRVARRLTAELAPGKEEWKARQQQRVTVLHADTVLAAQELLRPGCCDVIVTDAPYGVAHGSRTGDRPGRSRRPTDLLAAAIPGWAELLRHGGALGLSFNVHVIARAEVAELLTAAGLELVSEPADTRFEHWVDQGITRDLLIASKP